MSDIVTPYRGSRALLWIPGCLALLWASICPAQALPPVQNILPNTQWQLWTATGYITKPLVSGTGPESAISVASFQTHNNTPQLYTSNTQQVVAGDIGVTGFQWCYSGIGCVATPAAERVDAVVANDHIIITGNLGGISPAASTATTFTPITAGDIGTGTGQSADGWKKSGSLIVWADDWPANRYPGAIRVLGVRKGSTSVESQYWMCAPNKVAQLVGRTITFGVEVYQKVQGASGSWSLSALDGARTVTSSRGAGAGVGGYDYRTVTINVSPTATRLQLNIDFNGAMGDVYYVALPTAVIGASLSAAQLGQNANETIRPVSHFNPPLLTPLQVTTPATAYPGTSGQYGWSVDLEAISLGEAHSSIQGIYSKIEWTTHTVGAYILTGSRADYSLIFGPETVTNVADVPNVGAGLQPIADDGTFYIFSNIPSLAITSGTWDMSQVVLNGPTARN
jgi:hypothetical protein